MKRSILTLSILFTWASCSIIMAQEKDNDYTKYVDPFIGADGGGYTFPGSALPSGMGKVGTDCNKLNENAGWDTKVNIVGFSHTHINRSGGGCKYGNILFMPTVGEVKLLDYSSPRANERAEVGLYKVEMGSFLSSYQRQEFVGLEVRILSTFLMI